MKLVKVVLKADADFSLVDRILSFAALSVFMENSVLIITNKEGQRIAQFRDWLYYTAEDMISKEVTVEKPRDIYKEVEAMDEETELAYLKAIIEKRVARFNAEKRGTVQP